MRYTSTRDKNVDVSSSWAIAQGISADGGLFVPVEIPKVSLDDIAAMANMSYVERAKRVLSLYLTDFTAEELAYCVEGAYGDNKFSSEDIAPIHELKAGEEILELWRGPTCAFKDMALQMLPRLMTVSVKKAVGTRETVILVATSGDTGKAALEGFKDVEGTKILVFYPDEGVSPMQKLQMTTQEGSNVAVCAIKGNFDDAQTGVKTIFTDKEIGKKLAEHGMAFSSANSINWGRLVPQIVYYFSAYCDMIRNGRIKAGDKINFVVPTGNFGNILAAYYAREMGLPVDRLICASNKNRVLTDFFRGVPSLLFIYFFFLVLPQYKIALPSFWMLTLPVALAAAGVLAEIFRAGVNAVPRGQVEAAQALGLSKAKITFKIVLPQAIRFIIPSLISQLVVVVKDTTVAYVVSYPDLMQNARVLITNYDALVSVYLVIAVIYILINVAINKAAIYVSHKTGATIIR